eukprot:jgi/Tetstr1/425889/TSEL_016261.t2
MKAVTVIALIVLIAPLSVVHSRNLQARDRDYSGVVGKYCSGQVLRSNNKVNSCPAECNDQDGCDAFLINKQTGSCTLFGGCTAVFAEGCANCEVSVCTDNCPRADTTPDYVVLAGPQRCDDSSLLAVDAHNCAAEGCDPLERCYDMCQDAFGCTHFSLSQADSGRCALYQGCLWLEDASTPSAVAPMYYVGTNRARGTPSLAAAGQVSATSGALGATFFRSGVTAAAEAEPCFFERTGLAFVGLPGGEGWSRRRGNIDKCFEDCVGDLDVIVDDFTDGGCTCWKRERGRYVPTDNTQVAYDISDCETPDDSLDILSGLASRNAAIFAPGDDGDEDSSEDASDDDSGEEDSSEDDSASEEDDSGEEDDSSEDDDDNNRTGGDDDSSEDDSDDSSEDDSDEDDSSGAEDSSEDDSSDNDTRAGGDDDSSEEDSEEESSEEDDSGEEDDSSEEEDSSDNETRAGGDSEDEDSDEDSEDESGDSSDADGDSPSEGDSTGSTSETAEDDNDPSPSEGDSTGSSSVGPV